MPEPVDYRPLFAAVGASLLLHALVLVAADSARQRPAAKKPPPPLTARLQRPPPPAVAPAPQLVLPEPPAVAVRKPRPAPPGARPAPLASASVSREALAQLADHLLYPVEAVNRGIEGEVLVLLFLDAAGNVVAARVEQGSGHAILDAAAVAAARRLRALPTAAAAEVLLPVRFRLD